MDGRIIREILGWYVERGGTTKQTAYSDEKCELQLDHSKSMDYIP
jgi:hypothetical protein